MKKHMKNISQNTPLGAYLHMKRAVTYYAAKNQLKKMERYR
jgi:hypothetical protein